MLHTFAAVAVFILLFIIACTCRNRFHQSKFRQMMYVDNSMDPTAVPICASGDELVGNICEVRNKTLLNFFTGGGPEKNGVCPARLCPKDAVLAGEAKKVCDYADGLISVGTGGNFTYSPSDSIEVDSLYGACNPPVCARNDILEWVNDRYLCKMNPEMTNLALRNRRGSGSYCKVEDGKQLDKLTFFLNKSDKYMFTKNPNTTTRGSVQTVKRDTPLVSGKGKHATPSGMVNLNVCQGECLADKNCKGILTWHSDTSHTNQTSCTLLGPGVTFGPGYVHGSTDTWTKGSFTKKGGTTLTSGTFVNGVLKPFSGQKGTIRSSTHPRNLDSCKRECLGNPNCSGIYTWYSDGGTRKIQTACTLIGKGVEFGVAGHGNVSTFRKNFGNTQYYYVPADTKHMEKVYNSCADQCAVVNSDTFSDEMARLYNITPSYKTLLRTNDTKYTTSGGKTYCKFNSVLGKQIISSMKSNNRYYRVMANTRGLPETLPFKLNAGSYYSTSETHLVQEFLNKIHGPEESISSTDTRFSELKKAHINRKMYLEKKSFADATAIVVKDAAISNGLTIESPLEFIKCADAHELRYLGGNYPLRCYMNKPPTNPPSKTQPIIQFFAGPKGCQDFNRSSRDFQRDTRARGVGWRGVCCSQKGSVLNCGGPPGLSQVSMAKLNSIRKRVVKMNTVNEDFWGILYNPEDTETMQSVLDLNPRITCACNCGPGSTGSLYDAGNGLVGCECSTPSGAWRGDVIRQTGCKMWDSWVKHRSNQRWWCKKEVLDRGVCGNRMCYRYDGQRDNCMGGQGRVKCIRTCY
jgi:hypothetical protein